MDKMSKITKSDSTTFIIGIVLIAIGFVFFVGCYFITDLYSNSYSNNFYDVDAESVKAYVDTTYEPYAVAETEDRTEVYAIVVDENNVMYLIKGRVSYIQNEYKKQAESSLVRFRGVTYKTPSNIIEFTIDSYNEYADEEIVDESNYSSFFGLYYLDIDEYEEELYTLYGSLGVTGFFFVIIGIIVTTIGFIAKKNTKNVMDSEVYPLASAEIDNPELETKNAIFTKNYVVYNRNGLKIVDYKKITWVYLHVYTYNGVSTYSFAYHILGQKNTVLIPLGLDKDMVEKMINHVISKNPDVLVGYTQDNIKKNKELLMSIK